MKLIIFGSTGTVGRHLVDQALSLGHEVTAFARNPEELEIEAEDARSAGELGFMARIFVQATLPHSRPTAHEFERFNGRYSLHLVAPLSAQEADPQGANRVDFI
jgi:nucleoside-diphosphate-sugar epimerase